MKMNANLKTFKLFPWSQINLVITYCGSFLFLFKHNKFTLRKFYVDFTSNSAKKMSPVSSIPTGKFCSVAGISNFGHNGSSFFCSSEGLDPKMVFIGKQQNSMHFKRCFGIQCGLACRILPFVFRHQKGVILN